MNKLARPLLGAALAGMAVAFQAPSPPSRYEVRLTMFDEVVAPGSTVALRAKLEHAGPWGIHLHMRGYAVRFSCPGLINQEVKTAEEATATLQLKVPGNAPAVYSVAVSFPGSPHHQSARAAGHLFVWPKDSRILITDIDHTISDLSELKVPFTPNQQTPPLAGSVQALRELATSYRVIYLSARDEILYEKTRGWLREKGFPPGPLFCRDFHLGGKQETFKHQFIADLKKRYPGIAVGVGDQVSDAHAYLSNGLKAFLIEPAETIQAPKEAIIVRSWQEVSQRLRGR